MSTILTPGELDRLERERAGMGISAREVVRIFEARGVRFSEGTFRKYVQAGLLPRSRRVGEKGKNRGSRGVYPVSVVRRVNAVKAMMAAGMTLEEIRGSLLFVRGEMDVVEQSIAEVGDRLERVVVAQVPPRKREALCKEIEAIRRQAERLVERTERLAGRVVAARADTRSGNREWEGT